MDLNLQYENNRIFAQDKNGEIIAEITFPMVSDTKVDINHTFVHPSLRGQNIADILTQKAIEKIQAQNLKITISCSYVKKWFPEHPGFAHMLED